MEKRAGIYYGWVVLTVAFVTIALGYAVRNSFSVFYPAIVDEFGWGRGDTALMFSITIIVYGLVAPVAGSLADKFGPRLVFPAGACVMGGGLALCSVAASQWQFYLFYGVLVATGLSLVGWTPLTTIVSNWFVKKRGLVFGILAAAFGASLVSAPVVQLLISRFGWQMAYIIMGAFSVLVIVPLSSLFLRRSPKAHENSQSPTPTPLSHRPGTTASGQWAGTNWTPARAIKTYQFWLLFLIGFFTIGVAEQIGIAHQVYFFRDVGYEPMAAVTFYSAFGIAFVGGTLCSSFSDRAGRERIFIPSCLLAAAAVVVLFLIRDASRPWLPLLFAVGFGAGIGAAGPVFFATVADLFQGKHFGSIQGMAVLGFSLGGALSPWLAGFLHDTTGSYLVTFAIVLASLVVSAVLMWLIAPRNIRPVRSSQT